MVSLSITDSGRDIKISYSEQKEIVYINDALTRSKRDAKYNPTKNSIVRFCRTNNTIPIALFQTVKTIIQDNKLEYEFLEEHKLYRDIKKEDVISWCKNEVIGTEYADFDMMDTFDTVYEMVRNKHARFILSTSYGKTISLYLATKYLIDNGHEERILIITPKPQLSSQFIGEVLGMQKSGENFKYSAWQSKTKQKNTQVVVTNFQFAVNISPEISKLVIRLSFLKSFKNFFFALSSLL